MKSAINTKTIGLIKTLHSIVGLIPLGVYILFISFVAKATLKLGQLPSFDNPDPGKLGFHKFYHFVFYSFDWAIIAGVIWILLLVISRFFGLYKLDKFFFFLGMLGIILHLTSTIVDPFGLELWFFD